MTNVKMVASDTLHISSVSSDHLLTGQEFEVPGYVADDLEARGLASRVEIDLAPVGAAASPPTPDAPATPPEPEAPATKEADAPANKMEPAPVNKAAPKATKRRG